MEDHSAAGVLAAIESDTWIPGADFVLGEAFEKMTRTRRGDGAVSGEAFIAARNAKLADHAVLSFGPGIFTLDDHRLRGEDPRAFPKDLTIVGAGRDATLLTMGNIGGVDGIERLTFQNLTVDANNDGLFDLRRGSLSVRLEQCRVVRFDAGHGGCYTFSVRAGAAVSAVDTDFVGGYGRAPGMGRLLRGTPVLARFKNCRFELIELSTAKSLADGQLYFEGCAFSIMDSDPQLWNNRHVTVTGCTYEARERNAEGNTKNLADLFPGLEQ